MRNADCRWGPSECERKATTKDVVALESKKLWLLSSDLAAGRTLSLFACLATTGSGPAPACCFSFGHAGALRRSHSGASGGAETAPSSWPELLGGRRHGAAAASYDFAGAGAKIRELADECREFRLQLRVTLLSTATSEFQA